MIRSSLTPDEIEENQLEHLQHLSLMLKYPDWLNWWSLNVVLWPAWCKIAKWWPSLKTRKKRGTEENSISGLFIRPTWEKRVIRTKNEGRDEDEAHAV